MNAYNARTNRRKERQRGGDVRSTTKRDEQEEGTEEGDGERWRRWRTKMDAARNGSKTSAVAASDQRFSSIAAAAHPVSSSISTILRGYRADDEVSTA